MIIVIIGLILLLVVLNRLSKMFSQQKEIPPSGKNIFISGCDSGIGHELALHYVSLGMTVFAGCLQPQGDGAKRLRELGTSKLHVVPLDVTDQNSVQEAVKYVTEACSDQGLWALINNAGILVMGELDWLTMDQCEQQFDVNVLGTIRLTKACLRLLRTAKGRIILVTSLSGRMNCPGLAVYSATKRALEGFASSLRLELDKFSIKVVVVQPGNFVRVTNILSAHKSHMDTMWSNMAEEERTLYKNYYPAFNGTVCKHGGIGGTESIASSTLFRDMRQAVLSPSPKFKYLSATLSYKFIANVYGLIPSFVVNLAEPFTTHYILKCLGIKLSSD